MPVEFRCQNVMRKLVMMRVKSLVPDVLIRSIQFLPCSPRSVVVNVAWKPVRLQGLFDTIVRESGHEMRRMMNNFKALVMNVDEFVVVINLRWKSPSGALIRLSKCFILITPRVDIVPSICLAWLYLERCDQITCGTCLLKVKWVKCSGLED